MAAVSLPAILPSAFQQMSFVPGISATNIPPGLHKFPFQRLLFSIRKFQKMLETDFDRLTMHRSNIDKMRAAEDWAGLHREHVNALGTVQQVKVTLQELVRVRSRVLDSELQLFDKKVQDTKVKAVHAVQSFLRKDIAHQPQPVRQDVFLPSLNYLPGNLTDLNAQDDPTEARKTAGLPDTDTSPVMVPQTYEELRVLPENSQAAVSGEDLLQAAAELEEIVLCFASIVKEPASLDGGQVNPETATGQVGESIHRKKKGPNLRYAVLPVVGAVVGGVIAGPAGLVAGLRISGIAGAVGGSVAGLAGGTILKFTNQEASRHGDEQLQLQAKPLK